MITIRYENCGVLIYSDVKKKYYFTNDLEDEKKIRKYCNDRNNIINGELGNELESLNFFNEKIREIECVNKNNNYPISAPLEYYFDFTSKCNLRCKHCYNKENLSSTTMKYEKIVQIIEDMYNSGIMRIHLAGGEPTSDPEGLNIYMSTAKKYGIISSMSSNGVNINDDIYKIVFDNDLFSFTISLEGADEESNAKIRGKGNFEKSIKTIKKMVSLKKELKKNTIICIKMSYDTSVTYEELENFVLVGIALGVDVVKFANPERCAFHEKGFYGSVYEDYYKVLKMISNIKNKYDDKIYISEASNPVNECGDIGLPSMRGCIGAQELIAINPDGRISPCLMNQFDLGNIYDYESIKDFWNNSEKLKEYRKKIIDYNCNNCTYHSNCRGGCQVRKYVEYGEIKSFDPLCPMKEFNDELQEKEKVKTKHLSEIKVLHSL